MIQDQLSALVQLAKSDGFLDEREVNLIHKIGGIHGLTSEEINVMIESPPELGDLSKYNKDEKFEFLYNLVYLMKIDDQIFNEEVHYCQEIAMKLGYPLEALLEIYPYIYSKLRLSGANSKEKLKEKIQHLLND
jgi:uncharacterized membrane protein YebE (DUF533 family)